MAGKIWQAYIYAKQNLAANLYDKSFTQQKVFKMFFLTLPLFYLNCSQDISTLNKKSIMGQTSLTPHQDLQPHFSKFYSDIRQVAQRYGPFVEANV